MESNRLFGPATIYAPESEALVREATRYERGGGGPRARRVITHLALVLADALAVAVAFYLSWYLRYRLEWGGDVDPVNYVPFVTYVPLQVLLCAIVVVTFHLRGFYRLPRV